MECTSKLKKYQKTYNSGDSLVVTHRTTNPPVRYLISAEQTGRDISIGLWSYVKIRSIIIIYISSQCMGSVSRPIQTHSRRKFPKSLTQVSYYHVQNTEYFPSIPINLESIFSLLDLNLNFKRIFLPTILKQVKCDYYSL